MTSLSERVYSRLLKEEDTIGGVALVYFKNIPERLDILTNFINNKKIISILEHPGKYNLSQISFDTRGYLGKVLIRVEYNDWNSINFITSLKTALEIINQFFYDFNAEKEPYDASGKLI